MKEVPLQKREKNHPAAEKNAKGEGHGQWWGRRARWYDWGLIEYAPKEKLDFLQECIEDAIDKIALDYKAPQLRDLIDDIEICGSYAFGNQTPFSDFDIQLSAKNAKDQRKIEKIIKNKSSLVKTVGQDLAMRIKHNIEIHYSVHDNKKYNEIYSLRERKLYNREEGKPRPEGYHRKFDRKTMRYEVKHKNRSHSSDYWYENGEEKI